MFNINTRLVNIEHIVSEKPEYKIEIDNNDLLSLPDSLRKTFLVLINKKSVTATEVAKVTNRARAIESMYLNQLCLLKFAHKYKRGKYTVFDLWKGKK